MEVRELFTGRSDKHISHEESMVSSGTNNSNSDTVFLVPSCISINDVDTISCVEIIDGSFTVDSPDLLQVSPSVA